MDRDPTNEELRAKAAGLEQQLAVVTAELHAGRAELEEERARRIAAEHVIVRMKRDIERLERQIVGPKSERVVDPNELVLPDPVVAQASDPEGLDQQVGDSADNGGDDKKKRQKRRKGGRRKIAEMDELAVQEHRSVASEQVCPCGCEARGVCIGEDVSWRLEYTPAQLFRIKVVRERASFPDHQGPGPATVVAAAPPVSFALPRAMCGNALLAQVVIEKYADYLPLFRQERRFERLGLRLSRSTMCDWLGSLADFLHPIWKHMAREVLAGSWLRADATSNPVKDPTRVRGRVHRGHLWAWGNYDTVLFTYTPDKTAVTVASLFPDFKGVVLIDGASDFNLLEQTDGVVRAGCWAHARRYFYEALKYDRRLALRGLNAIRELFMAERFVMAAHVDERIHMRQHLCQPVLAGLRGWVSEELPRQIPQSPSHAALQYLDNQWDRLQVFLATPQIACHNNQTERELRGPVKGRVNWHYYESPGGAKMAATFYSFIGTCLLQGIDPLRYFVEILGRFDEPAALLTPHAIREQWHLESNHSK